MDVDAKTLFIVYIIGLVLSFIMTGINTLLTLAKVELVWTTLAGVLLSLLIFPFIYGAIVHLTDNFLMGETIDLDDTRILFPIWIVGVVLSHIMFGINSILEILNLTLDWTTESGVIVSLTIFPLLYGLIAHCVDQHQTT